MSSRLFLQLSLPTQWDAIDPIRQAVSLCVGAVFGASGERDAISMAASELLENGIKHGVPDALVELEILEAATSLSVTVTSRLAPGQTIDPLKERIEWINSFQSPADAYAKAMERAYAEMLEGGLGLPRIAHEGGCAISCESKTPETVTVTAKMTRKHH